MRELILTLLLITPLTAAAQETEEDVAVEEDAGAEQPSEGGGDAGGERPDEGEEEVVAEADPRAERASVHLELATAHFEAGRYDRALLELQTVRELTGRDDLLYNMARCYEAMERTDTAIAYYKRFLETNPEGEAHDDAVTRLAALESLDAAAPSEDEVGELPGAGTLIGLSVGGVGLLTGAIFGILTLVEDGELSSGCGATSSCTGEDLADIRVYRSVADLAFALAAIGGIAGTIGLFLWLGEKSEEEGEAEDARAVIAPWIVPGEGAGAAATVRF